MAMVSCRHNGSFIEGTFVFCSRYGEVNKENYYIRKCSIRKELHLFVLRMVSALFAGPHYRMQNAEERRASALPLAKIVYESIERSRFCLPDGEDRSVQYDKWMQTRHEKAKLHQQKIIRARFLRPTVRVVKFLHVIHLMHF